MKLIDATKAMENIDEIVCTMSVCINSDYCNGMRSMKDMALHAIEKQPTVDAIPVSYIYKKAMELKNDDMIYAYTVLNSLIANYRADGEKKDNER